MITTKKNGLHTIRRLTVVHGNITKGQVRQWGTKDNNAFKSRRTEGSPILKRKEPDNMEDKVLKTLLEIRNEMKEMRKENLEMWNEIKEIRKENANLRTEIQENAIGSKSLTDDIKMELEQWKEKEQIW